MEGARGLSGVSFIRTLNTYYGGLGPMHLPKALTGLDCDFKTSFCEFPGGLVVKTFSFHSSTPENVGSDPW